jgi:hypothetical protein
MDSEQASITEKQENILKLRIAISELFKTINLDELISLLENENDSLKQYRANKQILEDFIRQSAIGNENA